MTYRYVGNSCCVRGWDIATCRRHKKQSRYLGSSSGSWAVFYQTTANQHFHPADSDLSTFPRLHCPSALKWREIPSFNTHKQPPPHHVILLSRFTIPEGRSHKWTPVHNKGFQVLLNPTLKLQSNRVSLCHLEKHSSFLKAHQQQFFGCEGFDRSTWKCCLSMILKPPRLHGCEFDWNYLICVSSCT